MLEHLFGSRTRVKLISVFLSRPSEPLFVRELTRLIDTQINAVRRELANLKSLGLVSESHAEEKSTKRPGLKRKYYHLNQQYPLLPEIKSLIMKAQLLVEYRLDHELDALGDVRYAALLGAFLGIAHAPVDLFIVGSVDAGGLKKLLGKVERAMGKEVNYTIMTLQEYLYRKDMTDKFLYSVLEAPKNVVIDHLGDDPRRR
jgi:hypothetical protein